MITSLSAALNVTAKAVLLLGRDVGRRQRVGAGLTRDRQLGDINGVAAHDIDRRHTQNARGGIVSGILKWMGQHWRP